MVARTIIEAVQFYLRVVRENGIPVSFGVVYGSQARGTARADSDIDLLVVSMAKKILMKSINYGD
jgi:predicted nucleotidyltransferase